MVLGAAAALGGCGLVPRLAQQTTAAALAPFTTAAQVTNATLQTVGRGLSSMTSQTAHSSRQITTAMARSQPAAVRQQPRTVSYQNSRAAAPKAAPPELSQAKPDEAVEMDILPSELLARLTPDQAALQRAAQTEAFTAVVGETIFWHLEGREGTAVTETESVMGAFTCRTFVQTIALEDYFDKASVTACRTARTAWTRSF